MAKPSSKASKHSGNPLKAEQFRLEKAANDKRRRRRNLLLAIFAGVVVLALGISLALVERNRQQQVYDVSVIGKGVPVVVQVHDPSCPVCTALLKNVRSIESEFSPDTLIFKVARLDSDEGQAFAARYQAVFRTLLFFDGQGRLVDSQYGLQTPEVLRETFVRHSTGNL